MHRLRKLHCRLQVRSHRGELGVGRGHASGKDGGIRLCRASRKKKEHIRQRGNEITAECDCLAKDNPRIAGDVGILVSTDPVALDQASYDLVCRKAGGRDVFKESHPKSESRKQLGHAENLGLGTKKYDLVTL